MCIRDSRYAGPLKTADNVMTFKQIVRAIAMRNGLHASFLPKPLPQQAGSGLHINLSLYMDGKNLFEGDIAPDSVAGSFMAGVLAHSQMCIRDSSAEFHAHLGFSKVGEFYK